MLTCVMLLTYRQVNMNTTMNMEYTYADTSDTTRIDTITMNQDMQTLY